MPATASRGREQTWLRISRQALGALMADGRTRAQASDEIDALADRAQTSRAVAAGHLLSALPGLPPRPDEHHPLPHQ